MDTNDTPQERDNASVQADTSNHLYPSRRSAPDYRGDARGRRSLHRSDAGENADWTVVEGRWLCLGQTTPGGQNGRVRIERVENAGRLSKPEFIRQVEESLGADGSRELAERIVERIGWDDAAQSKYRDMDESEWLALIDSVGCQKP